MSNILSYIREKLSQLGKNLTLAQKVAMLLIVVLTFGFFITLVRWAVQPELTVLYTGDKSGGHMGYFKSIDYEALGL